MLYPTFTPRAPLSLTLGPMGLLLPKSFGMMTMMMTMTAGKVIMAAAVIQIGKVGEGKLLAQNDLAYSCRVESSEDLCVSILSSYLKPFPIQGGFLVSNHLFFLISHRMEC